MTNRSSHIDGWMQAKNGENYKFKQTTSPNYLEQCMFIVFAYYLKVDFRTQRSHACLVAIGMYIPCRGHFISVARAFLYVKSYFEEGLKPLAIAQVH